MVYPPHDSGWDIFSSTITSVATQTDNPSTARMLATDLLSRLTRDIVSAVAAGDADEDDELRSEIHLRALSALSNVCIELDEMSEVPGVSMDDTSNEVHAIILETLRAIVEQIGDVLVSGWDIVFDIICTAFVASESNDEDEEEEGGEIANEANSKLKTIQLGRSAFASTQLICSDFLASVPDASLLTLIATIRRFAKQDAELNMSLTATTLFWNLSDLLYGRLSMDDLDRFACSKEESRSVKEEEDGISLPGLWALLLGRIRIQQAMHARKSAQAQSRR